MPKNKNYNTQGKFFEKRFESNMSSIRDNKNIQLNLDQSLNKDLPHQEMDNSITLRKENSIDADESRIHGKETALESQATDGQIDNNNTEINIFDDDKMAHTSQSMIGTNRLPT